MVDVESSSLDDLFSDNTTFIEVTIFGRIERLPVRGDYTLSEDRIALIIDKIKTYGNPLIMDNDVYLRYNGKLYKWNITHLQLVSSK